MLFNISLAWAHSAAPAACAATGFFQGVIFSTVMFFSCKSNFRFLFICNYASLSSTATFKRINEHVRNVNSVEIEHIMGPSDALALPQESSERPFTTGR
ncbi:hypothetical protein BZA77DRAFT_329299 [Pyronema omphalodes]|nr:hypothetical protein BZA77DRAFT_329299 [Pyronema omphalodes]